MLPEPEYAQNIIVGVLWRTTFTWYVTMKEYWYLDYTKYDRAFIAAGYHDATIGDYSIRSGIAVLNEDSAEQFFSYIADSQIPTAALSQMMLMRKVNADEDDMLDFSPSLFVNFDQKQLISHYPEMIKFENYVPNGWSGTYRDFTPEIPKNERYWITDGHNLFTQK